ncbi:hypothetical protein V1264_012654 [Littorina saxatilis]|uniref:Ras-associating domain-containing protein n=1 Tax=Littorina saxatilis TaxID=31220 RepID=A0AAN9BXK6_9CAEN
MFQRGAQHYNNHTPGRPPGTTGQGGGEDWTAAGGSKSSSPASPRQQQQQQQHQQQQQQQEEGHIEKSAGAASRLAGRSPRSRQKPGRVSGSAPSTPRGERDKSRDRGGTAKSSSSSITSTTAALDRTGSGGKGGGGGGGVGIAAVVVRTARSLNRSQSKLASAPPTTTTSTGGSGSHSMTGSAFTSRALSEVEAELSVDARAPGVIKLFGESVVQGAQYKAVLASTRSTSQELVKQALERYGLPAHTFQLYVLCDCVGIVSVAEDTDDDDGDEKEDVTSKENTNNHVDVVDDNSDPSYASIGCGDSGTDCISGVSGGANKKSGGWTTVSSRVLDDADKPLELQMYWKPPEGLSRRFELHRRDDVIRETSVDDTSGLNDNARRIMMSKVPAGAIPPPSFPQSLVSISPDTGKRGEGNYARTGPEGRAVQPLFYNNNNNSNNNNNNNNNNKDNYFSKGSSQDREVKYAFVCPSIYPYLLTLRGRDIQKDLVLYPLKSKTLTVGKNHRRSHVDDIGLLADDVLDLHCRIHLRTLPAESSSSGSGPTSDTRRYWYYLQVEVLERAVVFVNGHKVEGTAAVHPGDLLGVGHHYLFLYKDPTGGHDVPETLPWYPGAASLYAKVNKGGGGGGKRGGVGVELDDGKEEVLKAMVNEVNSQEYFDLDDVAENGSNGEMPLTVPYPREREEEVLEHVTSISCSSPADFPLTTTILLMACHGHASRRFPPAHQASFFRRLLRAVRNRVSVVSKALSVQKYQR